MTLTANVKGYINSEEWGVIEQAPRLLTYEEIIAMTQEEAIAELNSKSTEYYDQLNNGGNIYFDIYLGINNIGAYNYSTKQYVQVDSDPFGLVGCIYTNGGRGGTWTPGD